MTGTTPSHRGLWVGDEHAGRNCPYCRFPLKPGAAVLECSECHSLHHSECWGDNGGCAVLGCAAAPARGAGKPDEMPPTAAVTQRLHRTPEPGVRERPDRPPASTREGASRGMVFAIVLLALAIAGGATAIALSLVNKPGATASRSGLHGARTVTVGRPRTPPRAPARTVSPDSSGATPTSGLPTGAASDVEQLLTSYYGAVTSGDMGTAWSLLSPSYKDWKLSAGGGKSDWLKNERLNQRYLDSGGLRASIRTFDPSTGVATVMVEGMTYTRPGHGPCNYQGITWALFDGGRWLYDQGYAHDSARAAEWRPRKNETLGVPCEANKY